jgi:predicted alpha/beta-hydrolase family hydrolase
VRAAAASTVTVPTPFGPAVVQVERPVGAAKGLLVLGHGAGGGIDAPDLLAVRAAALARSVAVARVLQPYRVAGRRAPAPAAQLDTAWTTVVEQLVLGDHLPVAVGGRSSGARVACRTAAATGACAVLGLAFPLHPPGRPDKTRSAELVVDVPLLVVQGDRDPFGTRAEFPPRVTVVDVAGADHRLASAGLPAVLPDVMSWLVSAMDDSPKRRGIGPAAPVL